MPVAAELWVWFLAVFWSFSQRSTVSLMRPCRKTRQVRPFSVRCSAQSPFGFMNTSHPTITLRRQLIMHLGSRIHVVPFALILLTTNCFAEEFENSVFRVDFNAKPQVFMDALGGSVSVTYFVKEDEILKMVQYEGSEINLQESLNEEAKAKLFRAKVDAFNQSFGRENTSAKTIAVQGYEGREVVCQSAQRGTVFARTIVAEHQLFQLTVLFKPGQKVDRAKAKAFFDSFTIVKESESKPDAFNIIKDKGKRFNGLALPNVRGFRHTLKGTTEIVEWYLSRKGKQLFGIFVYEFPGLAGDDIIGFTAARNTASNAGSRLSTEFREISNKAPWRDQAYQSQDGKYEMALKIKVVRERVFVAMACGPTASFGSDQQKEYLSRFKVLVK